jgi:HAD superfamily hydrolase (TIGR01509 family)
MPSIRLITIDLDDTLWPCDPTIMRAEQAHFAWIRDNAPAVALRYDQAGLREHRMDMRGRRSDIAHDLTALRLASLRELLAEHGYAEGLADQAMAHFLDHRNRVAPYGDVAPVLSALAQDHCLVSVTNGNAEVDRTPLRGHFHHAFRAEDVGAAKPDPALFKAALQACGATAGQAVHLGDDPLLDVAAARNFGMRAVWMNRFGRRWPADLDPPDAQVSDMYGFSTWLEDIQ